MADTSQTKQDQTTTKQDQRQYKALPVWVVEDHNDALQPIYRAIASRHLPFSGVTMLHFDSHPDLQIATDMDADVVFDKQELINSLSIENWIMPALYAGHIDHVIWVKPTWADQLPDETKHVHIGKHRDTGKLRVSWPDVYFLSDVLYAPVDKLDNSKSVTIETVTMETDILKSVSSGTGSTLVATDESCADENYSANAKRTKMDKDDAASEPVQMKDQKSNVTGSVADMEPAAAGGKTVSENVQVDKAKQALYSDKPASKSSKRDEGGGDGQPNKVKGHLEVVTKAISSPFILDIDLDFFSTKNPFKEVYTKEQYVLLEELYHFTPPSNDSENAIEYCQQERALQLKYLQEALISAWDGTEPKGHVNEQRFTKVKLLVASLRSHPPPDDTLDPELIHMAGLTCDDTGELPHHVSTQEQINSLVDAMATMLSRLPKPTIVTIARSSHDDYCPPDQVEGIQSQVLQTLESIYGTLDVHLDYDKKD